MRFILFGAGLDWLEGLLPAFFVGFWIVSQVVAALKRGPRQVERPKPVDPAEVRDRFEEEIHQLKELLRGRVAADPAERKRSASPRPVKPAAYRPRQRPAPQGEQQRPRRTEAPPPVPRSVDVVVTPAASVGSDIARHVHDAFAHDLAHAVPAARNESAPKPAATQLARMLRDPATIRQVIVLREVLERPTERWESV